MRGCKQADMFLVGQESRDCFDFISDVGIPGIYLSLALGTAIFKQLDYLCSTSKYSHHNNSYYYCDFFCRKTGSFKNSKNWPGKELILNKRLSKITKY